MDEMRVMRDNAPNASKCAGFDKTLDNFIKLDYNYYKEINYIQIKIV